jgi:hypothetical protein
MFGKLNSGCIAPANRFMSKLQVNMIVFGWELAVRRASQLNALYTACLKENLSLGIPDCRIDVKLVNVRSPWECIETLPFASPGLF